MVKYLCAILCLMLLFPPSVWARVQKEIPLISGMPRRPKPLKVINWQARAQAWDKLAFSFDQEGPFLPLISWDTGEVNFRQKSFFLPSYVGDYRTRPGSQEAINLIAAVVGATLAGIDKSDQHGENWVLMLKEFYNHTNGNNLVLNNPDGRTGSLWYTVFPSMLFFMLVDLYPELANTESITSTGETLTMSEITKQTAYRFLEMIESLDDFSITGYSFTKKEPVVHSWQIEGDGAAGLAWLCHQAYLKLGDPHFKRGAEKCLSYLAELDINPFYEVLLPYGVYTAARLQAEEGLEFDLDKLMQWCFQSSDVRKGWGVISDRWGDYDVHGLAGSRTDGGGYAFAMNSFQMAASLLPTVRYDPRYADALGKWALHVVSNARLFYPDELPLDHQSNPEWLPFSQGAVAYEGLRKSERGKSPYATGDAVKGEWAATNYALYGSSHVGFLAGLIHSWDREILILDLLKTDFGKGDAYPTYLYYNGAHKGVTITLDGVFYDLVTKKYFKDSELILEPNKSALLVSLPRDKEINYQGNSLVVEEIIVDYMVNMVAIKSPQAGPVWGEITPELELIIQSSTLQAVELYLDGELIYQDKKLPENISIDTTSFTHKSWHQLEVYVTLENGVRLRDTVNFLAQRPVPRAIAGLPHPLGVLWADFGKY